MDAPARRRTTTLADRIQALKDQPEAAALLVFGDIIGRPRRPAPKKRRRPSRKPSRPAERPRGAKAFDLQTLRAQLDRRA